MLSLLTFILKTFNVNSITISRADEAITPVHSCSLFNYSNILAVSTINCFNSYYEYDKFIFFIFRMQLYD